MKLKACLLNSAAVIPLARITYQAILREHEAQQAFHWHLTQEAKKVDVHKRNAVKQGIIDGVAETDWDEVIANYRRGAA